MYPFTPPHNKLEYTFVKMHLFPGLLLLSCVSALLTFTAWYSPDCNIGKGDVLTSPPYYCVNTQDRQSFQIDNDEQPDDWLLQVDMYWDVDCPDGTMYGRYMARNHKCITVQKDLLGRWGSSMMRVP